MTADASDLRRRREVTGVGRARNRVIALRARGASSITRALVTDLRSLTEWIVTTSAAHAVIDRAWVGIGNRTSRWCMCAGTRVASIHCTSVQIVTVAGAHALCVDDDRDRRPDAFDDVQRGIAWRTRNVALYPCLGLIAEARQYGHLSCPPGRYATHHELERRHVESTGSGACRSCDLAVAGGLRNRRVKGVSVVGRKPGAG